MLAEPQHCVLSERTDDLLWGPSGLLTSKGCLIGFISPLHGLSGFVLFSFAHGLSLSPALDYKLLETRMGATGFRAEIQGSSSGHQSLGKLATISHVLHRERDKDQRSEFLWYSHDIMHMMALCKLLSILRSAFYITFFSAPTFNQDSFGCN